MSLCAHIEIQFATPAPELIALKRVGVRLDPVRVVAARAPAERAHLRAVDHALRDEVVDAGHDVLIALREVVARPSRS